MRSNLLYITKSRIRSDLLTLLFLDPNKAYYARELQRRFSCSIGALARELKTLSAEKLLQREAKGKEVFYSLNQAHPLYNEIKGIVEKTRGIPVRLIEALQNVDSVKQAFIYGSFAKGGVRADSDIDLLLVGKETPRSTKILKQLQTKFGRSINATTYSPSEFERKRIDHSEFLFEVMKGPLLPLKTEGSHHESS